MSDLIMNTDGVKAVADDLKKINDHMKSGITSVDSAISTLNGSWQGSAATNVIDKYYYLKDQFCDSRYTVLNNYVNFLNQQIGAGYESTETTNIGLAERFK